MFHGTINEAAVYPREILHRALTLNAAKIILAHNHPSGHAKPSEADKVVTKIIKDALALIDIAVVDHIIIGNSENFSFADRGLL
jgi:DNA repair protein RadC